MQRWIGKVAVVTGASSGIGASIAEKLSQNGIIVAGFARRKERVESLESSKEKIHAVKVDMTKEDEIIQGFDWVKKNLGPVHILINNAGVGSRTTLINGDSQSWRQVIDTNIWGLCVATKEAVNDMKTNKVDGHIIHINSSLGHKVYNTPQMNVYPASKHAVTALAETLRYEFVQNNLNIKITSLSPGLVETEIFKTAGADERSLSVIKSFPSLKPEDIANGILYVLGTPPHVQVNELTIRPVGEKL